MDSGYCNTHCRSWRSAWTTGSRRSGIGTASRSSLAEGSTADSGGSAYWRGGGADAARPGHLVSDLLDVDAEPAGDGSGVLGSKRAVPYAGDDRCRCAQRLDPSLGRVQVEAPDRRAHRELEHRHGVLDERPHRRVAAALPQLARVLAGRLDGDKRL